MHKSLDTGWREFLVLPVSQYQTVQIVHCSSSSKHKKRPIDLEGFILLALDPVCLNITSDSKSHVQFNIFLWHVCFLKKEIKKIQFLKAWLGVLSNRRFQTWPTVAVACPGTALLIWIAKDRWKYWIINAFPVRKHHFFRMRIRPSCWGMAAVTAPVSWAFQTGKRCEFWDVLPTVPWCILFKGKKKEKKTPQIHSKYIILVLEVYSCFL